MATSKTTRMDAQGRVIIPPHIRKELSLNAGQLVTVSLDGDTIKVRPTGERCDICGSAADKFFLGPNNTHVCQGCALAIASHVTERVTGE